MNIGIEQVVGDGSIPLEWATKLKTELGQDAFEFISEIVGLPVRLKVAGMRMPRAISDIVNLRFRRKTASTQLPVGWVFLTMDFPIYGSVRAASSVMPARRLLSTTCLALGRWHFDGSSMVISIWVMERAPAHVGRIAIEALENSMSEFFKPSCVVISTD